MKALTCLDTDLLVGVLRGNSQAIEFLRKALEATGERARTTIFNEYELWAGAFLGPEGQAAAVRGLLSTLEVLPASSGSAELYGKLSADAIRHGRQIPYADLMIASVALENVEAIATRNEKHFAKIPGLKVVRW